MGDIDFIYIVAALLGLVVVWLLWQRRRGPSTDNEMIRSMAEQLAIVNEKLNHQQNTLFEGLNRSHESIEAQFQSTQNIIQEVTRRLTTLDETNKQVVGFASQLNSLEQILKNPKQRGVLGEYFLEKVLENVLPPNQFQLQYKFNNGEIVDAVIFTKDYIIPVDAKFSLSSYNKLASAATKAERRVYSSEFQKDLKQRINETAKYIRPDEGTYEFAFMFVPADGIYYELLNLEVASSTGAEMTIIEYAFKQKVILVSPVTLFAYLQTVLQGLRALQIEESVKQIQSNISKLQKYLNRYTHNLEKLGTHLGHAVSSYNKSTSEMRNIDREVESITGEKGEIAELKELGQPEDLR